MWTEEWMQSTDCRQTKTIVKAFDRTASTNVLEKTRDEVGRIIRFLTGHAHLNRHNFIVDKEGTATCRLCEQAEETPIHIIFQCPRLLGIRVQHIQAYVVDDDEIKNFYDHPGLMTMINNPTIVNLERYPETED